MAAIYKRELYSYFGNIMGWVFMALIFLVFGIYTAVLNLTQGYADFSLVPYNAQFAYLIVVPLLTMKSLAEEHRQRTDQLLYSSSLSSYEIVIGKYLSMLTIIAIPLLLCCIYPLLLSSHGKVALGTALSSMLAFFMLGAALIAIGLFLSSITSNQFVSATICFCVLLICYFANDLKGFLSEKLVTSVYFFSVLIIALSVFAIYMTKSRMVGIVFFAVLEAVLLIIFFAFPGILDGSVAAVLSGIALFAKIEGFCNGIFDISALIYYLSIAWLFIFFSAQAFDKRKWS